ncbi:MAG: DUF1648 domain-containing protein [Acidobacteriota bacterium]
MTPQFLAVLPAILLIAITFDLIRRRPRRGLYFGVTTGPGFAASPEGRAIARRYRFLVWFGCLLAIAVAYFAFPPLGPLLLVAIGLMAWLRAWRRSSHYAAQPGSIRSAPLQYDERISSWVTPLLLAAFLVLGLTAVALQLNYSSLPDRLPIHYGISGKADVFRGKSYITVFLPLLIGVIVTALLALNVYGIAFGSRRGGSPETQAFRTEQRRFLSRLLAVLAFGISLLFAYISLSPIVSEVGLPGGPWVILAFTIGIVGFALYAVLRWQEHAGASGDDTPDSCWKGGLIYYNAADPALMVERRDGLGYTPNFAQPLAWAIVALVAALVLTPVFLYSA